MPPSPDDPLGIIGKLLLDKISQEIGLIKSYDKERRYYLVWLNENRGMLVALEYITDGDYIEIRDHPDPDHLQIPEE